LFHEGAQIFIFPAPISCLGDRYLPATGEAFGQSRAPTQSTMCGGPFDEQNLKSSWS
jgi:hypothetical protein